MPSSRCQRLCVCALSLPPLAASRRSTPRLPSHRSYYASLGTSDDVFHMYLNGYLAWAEDNRIAVPKSRWCQKKDLDQLFVHVNAKGGGGSAARRASAAGPGGDVPSGADDKHNRSRALNRQEFLQVLVRVAAMRYVLSGQMDGVGEALRCPTISERCK